jgi:hypothetical protein
MKILILSLFLVSSLVFADPPRTSPIPDVTPGSTNPNVTQDNVQDTICKPGFTGTIRPSNAYFKKLKIIQLSADYKNDDMVTAHYEEDHLISLELGGNPTDPKNLWPQPYGTKSAPFQWNARKKDQLENALKRAICNGTITLETAQKVITIDWISAYKVYVKK